MSPPKAIRSKTDLDAFVTRMAAGKKAAATSRATSTATPSPKPPAKSGQNLNAVKAPPTKLPTPAKKSGVTTPTSEVGPGPGGHITVHVNIGRK